MGLQYEDVMVPTPQSPRTQRSTTSGSDSIIPLADESQPDQGQVWYKFVQSVSGS